MNIILYEYYNHLCSIYNINVNEIKKLTLEINK